MPVKTKKVETEEVGTNKNLYEIYGGIYAFVAPQKGYLPWDERYTASDEKRQEVFKEVGRDKRSGKVNTSSK
ncbi:MAG: hypothetical protein ACREBF_04040 [Candidatus Micrarchaeales archaeon]